MGWYRRLTDRLVGQGISRDLAILAGTQTVAAFGAGLIIPLLAPLLAELPDPLFPARLFGLPVTTELQVGILFSVFGIIRSAFQVPMGRLSDYIGVRKPFLEAGMLASAVTLYIYGVVGTVGALITVRALQGIALAVSTPALFAIVESVTVQDTRGGSMGFFSTMRTLGWGVGPIVGGVLVDLYSLSLAFTVGAILTGLAVVAIHLWVPEAPPGPEPDPEQPIVTDGAPARGDVLYLFSSRRQASTLLGLGLALVTLMMGFSAVVAMENPILERIGGTKAGFGIVFAITTLTRLVVQFPVGIASDRVGRKVFIVWGLLLSAPLVGLMGYAQSLIEFVALRGVLGIALAGVIAPAYALAADVVDDHRAGEQMAVVTTAFSVGFAFGPLLAGGVAFLGFAVPFLVAAVLTVIGGVTVWMLVAEPD